MVGDAKGVAALFSRPPCSHLLRAVAGSVIPDDRRLDDRREFVAGEPCRKKRNKSVNACAPGGKGF